MGQGSGGIILNTVKRIRGDARDIQFTLRAEQDWMRSFFLILDNPGFTRGLEVVSRIAIVLLIRSLVPLNLGGDEDYSYAPILNTSSEMDDHVLEVWQKVFAEYG